MKSAVRVEDSVSVDEGGSASSSSDDLVEALTRLNSALEVLEDVTLKLDDSVSIGHLAEDRALLARKLDECESRVSALTSTNAEVSRQLVSVMEKVRVVIGEGRE